MVDTKTNVTIITNEGKKLSPNLKKAKWGEDVYQLIHVGDFIFDETNDVKFRDIERGNQLIVKVTDANNHKRTFYNWIESVTARFDRGTDGTPTNEISLKTTSYPSMLTRNFIEGSYSFSKGYGQLVKKFTKNFDFNTNRVKLIQRKGVINFTKMPILEAIRRMASIEDWCFYFRDKEIIFEPCTPPKDSGVVLTDKEILSGTYTK